MIALALGVAACGKDKEAQQPLVFGKAAEPVGPLSKVKFGMSDVELAKAAPEFDLSCGMECEAKAIVGDREYTVTLTAVDRQVIEMSVYVAQQKLDTLTSAWGMGVPGDDNRFYYANADQTIRAQVSENDRKDGFHLTYDRLLPVERVIDKATWHVGGVAVLGKSGEDVRAAALAKGYELGEGYTFELPPTMQGAYTSRVEYTVVAGAVARYEVSLAAKTPEAKDQVLAALKTTLGEPTIEKDVLDKDILVYAKEPRVSVRDLGIGSLILTVEQPGVVIPE
jgi:hypothetical protein